MILVTKPFRNFVFFSAGQVYCGPVLVNYWKISIVNYGKLGFYEGKHSHQKPRQS